MRHPAMPLALILLAFILTLPALRKWSHRRRFGLLLQTQRDAPVKDRGYFVGSHRFGPAVMTLFEWLKPD